MGQQILTSNPDITTALCSFSMKVIQTTLSCQYTFGTYVMKILDLIWIGGIAAYAPLTNACLLQMLVFHRKVFYCEIWPKVVIEQKNCAKFLSGDRETNTNWVALNNDLCPQISVRDKC